MELEERKKKIEELITSTQELMVEEEKDRDRGWKPDQVPDHIGDPHLHAIDQYIDLKGGLMHLESYLRRLKRWTEGGS